MRAVASALSVNNFGEAVDLLRRYIPQPGEKDLRGIEWRYAWQAARSDEFRSFPQNHFVNCVRICPDGQVLAMSTLGGERRLIQMSSGQTLATFCSGWQRDDLGRRRLQRTFPNPIFAHLGGDRSLGAW